MHARSVEPIFAAALADDPAEIAATRKAGSTALHLAVAPTGASGTAGAGVLRLEIVRCLPTAARPWPTPIATRRRGRPDPEPSCRGLLGALDQDTVAEDGSGADKVDEVGE